MGGSLGGGVLGGVSQHCGVPGDVPGGWGVLGEGLRGSVGCWRESRGWGVPGGGCLYGVGDAGQARGCSASDTKDLLFYLPPLGKERGGGAKRRLPFWG